MNPQVPESENKLLIAHTNKNQWQDCLHIYKYKWLFMELASVIRDFSIRLQANFG